MAKNVHLRYENLAKQLISHFLGFEEASEEFQKSVKYVMSNLLYHQCLDVNSHSVERTLQGIAFKMEIHGHQNKAKKLISSTRTFLSSPSLEDKGDLKWSLLLLLLNLGYHPAREDLSESFEALESNSRAQDLTSDASEWYSEATELPPFQWLDKDDTLSEWSDVDEESNLSEMLRSQEKSIHEFQDFEPATSSASSDFIRDARRQLAEEIQPCTWSKASDCLTFSCMKGSSVPILSEYVVMRECLWVLMQPGSGCVFKEEESGFTVQPITISSLSQECTSNILKPISRGATHLKRLDSWVSEELQSKSLDGTLKAYSDALRGWRHIFRNELLSLEKDVMGGDNSPSLLWLMNKLEAPLRSISILQGVHSEALDKPVAKRSHLSLRLLGLLVKHADSSLNVEDRHLILSVLLNTLSFLLNSLESWLWGPHPLPFDLFGIKEVPVPGVENTITVKYIAEEAIDKMSGMEFLLAMQETLIEVAHLKNVLKNLNSESLLGKKENLEVLLASAIEAKHSQAPVAAAESPCVEDKAPVATQEGAQEDLSFEYPDPYLQMAFELDSPARPPAVNGPSKKPPDRNSVPISCKVSNLLVEILVPILQEYSIHAGHQLLSLLKDKYSLSEQLKLFKAASLLEHGNLIRDFYSHLYSQVDARERIDASDLTLHLRYSLEDSSPQFAHNLSVTVDISRSKFEQNEVINYTNDLLSSIKLHYKVDWPINLILNEEVVSQYSKLFSFCLTIKKAVVALEEFHFRELASFEAFYEPQGDRESPNILDPSFPLGLFPTKKPLKEELPLRQRVHRLQLLKHWLLFFAKTLYDHFYVAVLLPFSCRVDGLLRQQCHFDYFIKEHTSLLESASRDCLLSDNKSSPIAKVFTQIFRTIDETRRLWRGDPSAITNQALQNLEENYSSCHRFLAHFFSSLSQSRYSPLIERLSETLANNCPI